MIYTYIHLHRNIRGGTWIVFFTLYCNIFSFASLNFVIKVLNCYLQNSDLKFMLHFCLPLVHFVYFADFRVFFRLRECRAVNANPSCEFKTKAQDTGKLTVMQKTIKVWLRRHCIKGSRHKAYKQTNC